MSLSSSTRRLVQTVILASLATTAIACDAVGQDADGATPDTEEAALTTATYPSACKDLQRGQGGVCVLGFTDSTGLFTILRNGVEFEDAYLNSFRALAAGSYKLQHANGGPSVAFTVQTGKVTTLKTGSLVLTSRSVADLQTTHDAGTTTCVEGTGLGQVAAGSYALIAGTYIADYGGATCTANEIEAAVSAGKATTVQF